MLSKEQICKKIEEVIPEAGHCGIDFDVQYNDDAHAWQVDLKDGEQHLTTFIEESDAERCLDKGKCLPLALQIGQLKRNLNLYHES